jgi:hypothetical protein
LNSSIGDFGVVKISMDFRDPLRCENPLFSLNSVAASAVNLQNGMLLLRTKIKLSSPPVVCGYPDPQAQYKANTQATDECLATEKKQNEQSENAIGAIKVLVVGPGRQKKTIFKTHRNSQISEK